MMQTLPLKDWLETPCPPEIGDDVCAEDLEPVHRFLAITEQLPKCSRNGPWIVGGTIRRLVDYKDFTTDIDVMFKNLQQYEDYCGWLREHGAEILKESDNQITFSYQGWEIQPIKAEFSNTLIQTLKKFDFTICQFGFDGTNLVWGDHSMEHLKEQRLVFVDTNDHISSMRRAFKYANQGFFMDHETISKFLNHAVCNTEKVGASTKKWRSKAKALGNFPASYGA